MLELLIKTVFVGLIDSINQTTFAITIYLLGTKQPIRRTLFFILGIVFSYSLAGFLVYLGFGGFFFKIFTFHKTLDALLGLLFGCTIFLIPFFCLRNKPKKRKYPSLNHPFLSLFAGAALTLAQIPFTIPFLYLMQQLAQKVQLEEFPFFLLAFNLLVTLPLLLLLGAFILFHDKAKPFLQNVDDWVIRNSQNLLKGTLILLGFFIILDATSSLIGKPLFNIYEN